ncbi:MAG: hypothetical protein A2X87_08350 [Deltaproteobacteria bacterium GWC2_42_51]|nr:MAG: hypothetical protein A2056_05290 [Deltaproteobacteria bacterium GWA2_42_85]OGP31145.1 MAG: hypothetical protein A2X87_08350 [Deltaproteobacteria bacterium GWC2_42_51]OGP44744.1 MAG: hypothetical protein A2090_08850 [Deltaproteobacteria bacterium GWD2_42_10]OGP47362.1 MAG: hypothetical protein A2022_03700 [Deltaproteobacteria bacterium GWF2_42_12]OGQ30178.1 MAG: hypothetical protein A3D29_06325 [Deltaproteobacteria bacterium RIFCSPHIGHO2_02_FULL_42_44]OGQ35523.1 MAG: hypothetical protei
MIGDFHIKMKNTGANKWGIPLLLLSASLIALSFSFAKVGELQIPSTSVSVSHKLLWLPLFVVFLFFINEVRSSDLLLSHKLKRKFHSELATWSRKRKEYERPGFYTPQYLPISKNRFKTKWECKYCQAGRNLEPSVTYVSGILTTISLFLSACVKVFFQLSILVRFTLPVIVFLVAIISKVVVSFF